MATIETTCPHCHRQSQIRLISRVSEGSNINIKTNLTAWSTKYITDSMVNAQKKFDDFLEKRSSSPPNARGDLMKLLTDAASPVPYPPKLAAFAGQCSFVDCGGPSLLIGSVSNAYDKLFTPGEVGWATTQVSSSKGGPFELIEVLPPTVSIQAQSGWPSVVREQLPEIIEDLGRGRNPSRILASARTILDVVLKDLLRAEMPKGRSSAIELLREKGLITVSISEWSKSLWKDGSDAAHDGIGEAELAEAYIDFLKILLEICYKLPETIADIKKKEAISGVVGRE